MNRRRTLAAALAASLLAAPFGALAQASSRTLRVGILVPTSPAPDDGPTRVVAALRELGYAEGRTLQVARRYAEGHLDRMPAMARELAQSGTDVLVVVGSAGVRAAKESTSTLPVVFYGNFDPVAEGLVASLARPGGNMTGVLIAADGTLAAKRLELLKETVPRTTRVAALFPDDPNARLQLQEVRRAAAASGIELQVVEVRGGDYERAFASIAAGKPGALFVAGHTYFVRDRRRIIELAAKHRLPATYEWPEQAEAGGLMSYGSSLSELYRRVAGHVDRIAKGAKPGELPIEQPTKYELVVNLKTARALDLAIPAAILQRADRVIE